MKRLILSLLALTLFAATAAADSIEVIELRNRPAADLIPVIRPMLDAGGSLTGQGFQLIVRSNPGNLEQIRHLVNALDTAPEQLLISVFQGTERDLRALAMSGGLRYENDHVEGSAGDHSSQQRGAGIRYSTDGTSVTARTLATRGRLSDNPIHQLRVTSGSEGYVETGQSIPYFSGSVWRGPRGTSVESAVDYKDVTTGFYVLPRVRGEHVTLEISPHKNAVSQTRAGAIDTQRATTTVSGPLGEWLQIGGVTEQVERSGSGIGNIASTGSRTNASIWIRAERVP